MDAIHAQQVFILQVLETSRSISGVKHMRVIPLFCRVSYDGQSFLLMLQVSFPLQLVLTKYCVI